MVGYADKGKPVERRGRKTTGLSLRGKAQAQARFQPHMGEGQADERQRGRYGGWVADR